MGTDNETPSEEKALQAANKLLDLFYTFMKSQGYNGGTLCSAAKVCSLYMSNHYPGAWNKNPIQNTFLAIACMNVLLSTHKTAMEKLRAEEKPEGGAIDLHSFALGLCFGHLCNAVRGEVEKVHATILAGMKG